VVSTYRTLYSIKSARMRSACLQTSSWAGSREFQRRQPTMLQLKKVSSLASMSRSGVSKRIKLGDNCSIELGAADHRTLFTATGVLECMNLLTTGWEIAGCFKVSYRPPGAQADEMVLFCHRSETQAYRNLFWFAYMEVASSSSSSSIAEYFVSIHDDIMVKVLELVREPNSLPYGEALSTACKLLHYLWQEFKHLLCPIEGTKGGQRQPKESAEPDGRRVTLTPNKRFDTASRTESGAKLCKMHNDNRGCSAKCRNGDTHACDVLLASGMACADKSHKRAQHNEAQHGAARARKLRRNHHCLWRARHPRMH
jgi:hypothetical protein